MIRPAGLEQHPDLIEMRERYERAGSSTAAQGIDGLSLLAGLWLAISPWVVGFNGLSRISVSNLVTGIALAALAMAFAAAFGRTYGLSWIAAIIGIWTIIVPWVTRSATTSTIWTNVVTGVIIFLLGMGAVAVSARKMPNMGGRTSHMSNDMSGRTSNMPGSSMPGHNMPGRP
ncbi:SPW repeat-containing protein [Streptosporangium subroseum]|uniref:SPW repeat-containing protein n=1 Tax=Streptosporangium subroseum TaxID=106412 RepID=A0A239BI82_9ACTN|nr:SPW repeat-containing protein [Streptosporangium subroseum]